MDAGATEPTVYPVLRPSANTPHTLLCARTADAARPNKAIKCFLFKISFSEEIDELQAMVDSLAIILAIVLE